MIKLNATSGTYTSGQTIAFSQVFNSNPKLSFNNNTIYIKGLGYVEPIGGINVKATAVGNYGINIVADGNIVATYYADASAGDDVITIPIYELFRIIPTSILNGYATISFTVVNDLTITGGIVSLKYIN